MPAGNSFVEEYLTFNASYNRIMIVFISSSKHEVLKMSYCDRYLCVVRLSVLSVRPSVLPSTISSSDISS